MSESKYVPSKKAEALLANFRLLDDDFMTIFFNENFEAVALVLNIILNRDDIQIKELQVQKKEKSVEFKGRDAILDIFAIDSEGKNYDIEIQRADRGAGRRRARFLSGVLDSRMLNENQDFSEMRESYVIFITENDVMKGGLPMYHVERKIEELGEPFGDGNHIIYVNGSYKNDKTDIGRLMHDFRCTSSIDMFFDVLKMGMYHYKETEGGRSEVCRAVEKVIEQEKAESRAEGRVEGRAEGKAEGKKEMAIKLRETGMELEQIAFLADVTIEVVRSWFGLADL